MANTPDCGDYPAPCNCDNPVTHDKAEVTPEWAKRNEVVSMFTPRLESNIGEYKAFAKLLNVIASDHSIPVPSAVEQYQKAMGKAEVAFLILSVFNRNFSLAETRYRVLQIADSATNTYGVKLAVEIERALVL